MITLDVSIPKLQEVIDDLLVTDEQVDRAMTSAARKLAGELNMEFRAGVADAVGVTKNVVQKRVRIVRVQKVAGKAQFKLWLGTNRVSMIHLKPRENSTGVAAEVGRQVDGAFIATGRTGKEQVFKRRGKARLKIDKQFAEIKEQSDAFVDRFPDGVGDRFIDYFEQELGWRK